MGAVFGVIVVLTIASYYVGLCVAPWGDAPAELTGLSVENLRNNLKPGFDPDVSFSMVVSIFFPCFTGILSGANRATALKEPGKSITRGTIGAINVSLLMYTSFFLLWGAVAPREYLKHGAARPEVVPHGAGRRLMAGGDAGSLGVVADIAWPMAMVTQIGVIIASISQALQCLVVAPRLLQVCDFQPRDLESVADSFYLLNVGTGCANTVANITTSQKPVTPMGINRRFCVSPVTL